MVSKSLIIGVAVIVVVVAVAAVFLVPSLLKSSVIKTAPSPEVALKNSLALLSSQYTVWVKLTSNVTASAYSMGMSFSMPIAFINSSNLEVSYTNVTGLKLYIAGPITATLNVPPMKNTTQAMLGLAVFMNKTALGNYSLCIAVAPSMLNLTNTAIPPGYTSAVSCYPISTFSNVPAYSREIMSYIIGNLTYVGNEAWNGQTAYCFATKEPVVVPLTNVLKTMLPPSASSSLVNATIKVNIMSLCLLKSGYTTYAQGNVAFSITIQEPYGTTTVPFTMVINTSFTVYLINYSSTFDTKSFNALLQNPYILPVTQPTG